MLSLNLNKILIVLCNTFILFITSCSFFETREPENPIVDGGVFIPPITPNIVVENLKEAFNNKNPNNYYNCFSAEKYVFLPSADVVARYPSLFSDWKIDNERQYMIANCAALEKESKSSLNFAVSTFDFISADSAILISNYTISCNLKNSDIPDNYSGRLILTITPEKSGTWAISGLQDFRDEADSNKYTWSQLKAYFSN